jgi:RNA polymerase sigma-70 factor, ECF subfamily
MLKTFLFSGPFRVPTATQAVTDLALAHKAAGGCRQSFATLIDRHYDRIYRLAWRWCGSRAAAEDVTQDVCVKLAGAIRSFRGDSAFTTWLHRIAYTTALDYLRVNQRTVAVEPSHIIQLVDDAGGTDVDDGSSDDALWQAVRGLPPQQRDAVLLVYAEDMSHAEAGAIMGCSEKTVSWHIHEAKKKLKILLKAAG